MNVVRILVWGLFIYVGSTVAVDCAFSQEPESPTYRDGFIELEQDVRLFYRVYGDGAEPLVLLHGGPGLNFMGVGPDLVPLANRHRLLMYDQRGGGRSTLGQDSSIIGVESHVGDLEAVRRHFNIERMVLIGHSWGAGLATFYAAQYPQHVARMILIGPMEPTLAMYHTRVAALEEADPEGAEKLAALSERPDLADDPLALCRAIMAIGQRQYYFDPSKWSNERQGDYCDVPPDAPARHNLVAGYVWESLGEYDLRPLMANLEMPVLVVEGAQTPIPLVGYQEWARSLPNARLWLVDGVGHAYPFVEAPEVFFPGVERFLRGDWPTEAKSILR